MTVELAVLALWGRRYGAKFNSWYMQYGARIDLSNKPNKTKIAQEIKEQKHFVWTDRRQTYAA